MKYIIVFFMGILLSTRLPAQSAGIVIYLGEEASTNFVTGYCQLEKGAGYSWRIFPDYPIIRHDQVQENVNEETNRDGLILTGKKTMSYQSSGEIVIGNIRDSAVVEYARQTEYVHHGRSATISVINIFSKDKNKQEPFDEIRSRQVSGMIRNGGRSLAFGSDWIQWGEDTLRIIPAPKIRKLKNGKIKRGSGYEGEQLMLGNNCIAAIDFIDTPATYYLGKDLSDSDKLFIISFLQARELLLRNILRPPPAPGPPPAPSQGGG